MAVVSEQQKQTTRWTVQRFLAMFAPTILVLILGFLLLWGSISLSSQSSLIREAELKSMMLEHLTWIRQLQLKLQEERLIAQDEMLAKQDDRLAEQTKQLLLTESDLNELERLYEMQSQEGRQLSAELDAVRTAISDTESMRFYQRLLANGATRATAIWELGGGKSGAPTTCPGNERIVQKLRSRVPLVLSVINVSEQQRIADSLKGLCSETPPSYGPNYPSRLLREYAVRMAKSQSLEEQFASWCPRHPDLTFISPTDPDSIEFHRYCRATIEGWLTKLTPSDSLAAQLRSAYVADLWSDAGFNKKMLNPNAAGVRLRRLVVDDSGCASSMLGESCGRVLLRAASSRFDGSRLKTAQDLACAARELLRKTDAACQSEACESATRICAP